MPETETIIPTQDILHVILDAITLQRDAIKSGNTPWRSYDSDDEPIATKEGYLDTLDAAEGFATAALEGAPLPDSPTA